MCRNLGIREQTCSRWRKQFQGMGVAQLRRLRQLEEGNARLKQLVADLTLDKHMLLEASRRPRTPTETPYSEAFNGRFREACQNQHWFVSLENAQRFVAACGIDYHQDRPHSAVPLSNKRE